MKFLYIRNYLLLTSNQKKEFFKYLNSFSKFKFTNYKFIISDDSMLLEFTRDSNLLIAKTSVNDFFESNKKISVNIIDKLIKHNNELIMEFKNNNLRRVKL